MCVGGAWYYPSLRHIRTHALFKHSNDSRKRYTCWNKSKPFTRFNFFPPHFFRLLANFHTHLSLSSSPHEVAIYLFSAPFHYFSLNDNHQNLPLIVLQTKARRKNNHIHNKSTETAHGHRSYFYRPNQKYTSHPHLPVQSCHPPSQNTPS